MSSFARLTWTKLSLYCDAFKIFSLLVLSDFLVMLRICEVGEFWWACAMCRSAAVGLANISWQIGYAVAC